MPSIFIKFFVRSLFNVTTREKALAQSERIVANYQMLADNLNSEEGQKVIKVPPMRGVDENMRNWSFFMILKHNAIVNQSITATITQLARNEILRGAAVINSKTDVMPSNSPGPEQVKEFIDSVRTHQKAIGELGNLRGTRTSKHPVFGFFDAHKWNCMFSFHLGLHLPQAKYVAKLAQAEKERLN